MFQRPTSVLFVVGLRTEARLLGPGRRVLVGADGLGEALEREGADLVVSFGLCGALDPGLAPGSLIVADLVVDGATKNWADTVWTERVRRALDAWEGALVGSDVIVGSRAAKAALATATGAAAVDMESHKVARAAKAAGVPFIVARAVSDGADQSLPLSAQAGFRPDGRADIAAVLSSLSRRPWEIRALIRTAREASAGFEALRRAVRALVDLDDLAAGAGGP